MPNAQPPTRVMAVPAPQLVVSKTRDEQAIAVTVLTVFGTLTAVVDANTALEVARQLRELGKEVNQRIVAQPGGPNGAVLLSKPLPIAGIDDDDQAAE